MNRCIGLWVIAGLLAALAGCVNVKAPERIVIGGDDRPPPVDSGRVPQTATHAEAQRELEQAYANVQYLERENVRLREKAEEYKRERDEARKRLKRYEQD